MRMTIGQRRVAGIVAVLLSLCAPPTKAVAQEPQNDSKPTPLGSPGNWVTSDDYPTAALEAGIEGTTAFSLTVGVNGKVIDCVITTSSGSAALDDATCLLIRQRALFKPATDSAKRPVEANWTSRIVWQMPDAVPMVANEYPKRLRFTVDVDTIGNIERCVVTEAVGDPTFDPRTERRIDPCEAMRKSRTLMPVLDSKGQPVRATVETLVETKITPH